MICPTASASWLSDSTCSAGQAPWTMKTCPPSTDQDPRHVGWPCLGHHVPGPQRTNKYAAWQACNHCGLRLRYSTKGAGTGDTRAIGPPPDQVELAQQELMESFQAHEVTEKIFNGKLLEIRGRTVVETRGRGRTTVQVRANEALGEALMAGASCSPAKETVKTTAYPKAVSPLRQSPPKPSTKTEPEALQMKKEEAGPQRAASPMSVSSRVSSSAVIVNEAEFEQVKKELREAKAKIDELAAETKVKKEATSAE